MGQSVCKCCNCTSSQHAHRKTSASSYPTRPLSADCVWTQGSSIPSSIQRHTYNSSNDSDFQSMETSMGDDDTYTKKSRQDAASAEVITELFSSSTLAGDTSDLPVFVRKLRDVTIKVGSKTRLVVEIVGTSDFTTTWYRNDNQILANEEYQLVHEGNLFGVEFSCISVEDNGRWTCSAENNKGRVTTSCYIQVAVPKSYKKPIFYEDLDAILTEEGTVSLQCKVIGVPTPILRWFKDGREIRAGDMFALTANHSDQISLGTYTCEASNCLGKAYSTSGVNFGSKTDLTQQVKEVYSVIPSGQPPIFTKELKNDKIKVGETFIMSCKLAVPPWPKSVRWKNPEDTYIEAVEGRYRDLADGIGGYMLEVLNAEQCDRGQWKCVALSQDSSAAISACEINVSVPKNYRKPYFVEKLKAVLTEDGLVSFECKVVGYPTPHLRWFKDGSELKAGDIYQLTGVSSLGSYICIARNCMGEASSEAELTVEDIRQQLSLEESILLSSIRQPPKFLRKLASAEVQINTTYRFTVQVQFPPAPKLFWYRDEQLIDIDDKKYTQSTESLGVFHLDIIKLEFADQAEWKCIATNEFGRTECASFLKLTIPKHFRKPKFLENLRAILTEAGIVNLECKVIGVPQPSLKWFKDGVELNAGDIHKIMSGQDGTCCLGVYTCEARNCMGAVISSASVHGIEDTSPPKTKSRKLSLSTINEEDTFRTADDEQSITLDQPHEISYSFDGKEISVSFYDTPDLTNEEAVQIVEMYADQLSEHISEHNVLELPPLRIIKETSTASNILMEGVVIDVLPEYFSVGEEDQRTEADIEDMSVIEDTLFSSRTSRSFLEEDRSEVRHRETAARISKSESFHSPDMYYSLSEARRDDTSSSHTTPIGRMSLEPDSETFASAKSFEGDPIRREKAKLFLQDSPDRPQSTSGISYAADDIEFFDNADNLEDDVSILRHNAQFLVVLLSNNLTDIQQRLCYIERELFLKSLSQYSTSMQSSLQNVGGIIRAVQQLRTFFLSLKSNNNEENTYGIEDINAIAADLQISVNSIQESILNSQNANVQKDSIKVIYQVGETLVSVLDLVADVLKLDTFELAKGQEVSAGSKQNLITTIFDIRDELNALVTLTQDLFIDVQDSYVIEELGTGEEIETIKDEDVLVLVDSATLDEMLTDQSEFFEGKELSKETKIIEIIEDDTDTTNKALIIEDLDHSAKESFKVADQKEEVPTKLQEKPAKQKEKKKKKSKIKSEEISEIAVASEMSDKQTEGKPDTAITKGGAEQSSEISIKETERETQDAAADIVVANLVEEKQDTSIAKMNTKIPAVQSSEVTSREKEETQDAEAQKVVEKLELDPAKQISKDSTEKKEEQEMISSLPSFDDVKSENLEDLPGKSHSQGNQDEIKATITSEEGYKIPIDVESSTKSEKVVEKVQDDPKTKLPAENRDAVKDKPITVEGKQKEEKLTQRQETTEISETVIKTSIREVEEILTSETTEVIPKSDPRAAKQTDVMEVPMEKVEAQKIARQGSEIEKPEYLMQQMLKIKENTVNAKLKDIHHLQDTLTELVAQEREETFAVSLNSAQNQLRSELNDVEILKRALAKTMDSEQVTQAGQKLLVLEEICDLKDKELKVELSDLRAIIDTLPEVSDENLHRMMESCGRETRQRLAGTLLEVENDRISAEVQLLNAKKLCAAEIQNITFHSGQLQDLSYDEKKQMLWTTLESKEDYLHAQLQEVQVLQQSLEEVVKLKEQGELLADISTVMSGEEFLGEVLAVKEQTLQVELSETHKALQLARGKSESITQEACEEMPKEDLLVEALLAQQQLLSEELVTVTNQKSLLIELIADTSTQAVFTEKLQEVKENLLAEYTEINQLKEAVQNLPEDKCEEFVKEVCELNLKEAQAVEQIVSSQVVLKAKLAQINTKISEISSSSDAALIETAKESLQALLEAQPADNIFRTKEAMLNDQITEINLQRDFIGGLKKEATTINPGVICEILNEKQHNLEETINDIDQLKTHLAIISTDLTTADDTALNQKLFEYLQQKENELQVAKTAIVEDTLKTAQEGPKIAITHEENALIEQLSSIKSLKQSLAKIEEVELPLNEIAQILNREIKPEVIANVLKSKQESLECKLKAIETQMQPEMEVAVITAELNQIVAQQKYLAAISASIMDEGQALQDLPTNLHTETFVNIINTAEIELQAQINTVELKEDTSTEKLAKEKRTDFNQERDRTTEKITPVICEDLPPSNEDSKEEYSVQAQLSCIKSLKQALAEMVEVEVPLTEIAEILIEKIEPQVIANILKDKQEALESKLKLTTECLAKPEKEPELATAEIIADLKQITNQQKYLAAICELIPQEGKIVPNLTTKIPIETFASIIDVAEDELKIQLDTPKVEAATIQSVPVINQILQCKEEAIVKKIAEIQFIPKTVPYENVQDIASNLQAELRNTQLQGQILSEISTLHAAEEPLNLAIVDCIKEKKALVACQLEEMHDVKEKVRTANTAEICHLISEAKISSVLKGAILIEIEQIEKKVDTQKLALEAAKELQLSTRENLHAGLMVEEINTEITKLSQELSELKALDCKFKKITEGNEEELKSFTEDVCVKKIVAICNASEAILSNEISVLQQIEYAIADNTLKDTLLEETEKIAKLDLSAVAEVQYLLPHLSLIESKGTNQEGQEEDRPKMETSEQVQEHLEIGAKTKSEAAIERESTVADQQVPEEDIPKTESSQVQDHLEILDKIISEAAIEIELQVNDQQVPEKDKPKMESGEQVQEHREIVDKTTSEAAVKIDFKGADQQILEEERANIGSIEQVNDHLEIVEMSKSEPAIEIKLKETDQQIPAEDTPKTDSSKPVPDLEQKTKSEAAIEVVLIPDPEQKLTAHLSNIQVLKQALTAVMALTTDTNLPEFTDEKVDEILLANLTAHADSLSLKRSNVHNQIQTLLQNIEESTELNIPGLQMEMATLTTQEDKLTAEINDVAVQRHLLETIAQDAAEATSTGKTRGQWIAEILDVTEKEYEKKLTDLSKLEVTLDEVINPVDQSTSLKEKHPSDTEETKSTPEQSFAKMAEEGAIEEQVEECKPKLVQNSIAKVLDVTEERLVAQLVEIRAQKGAQKQARIEELPSSSQAIDVEELNTKEELVEAALETVKSQRLLLADITQIQPLEEFTDQSSKQCDEYTAKIIDVKIENLHSQCTRVDVLKSAIAEVLQEREMEAVIDFENVEKVLAQKLVAHEEEIRTNLQSVQSQIQHLAQSGTFEESAVTADISEDNIQNIQTKLQVAALKIEENKLKANLSEITAQKQLLMDVTVEVEEEQAEAGDKKGGNNWLMDVLDITSEKYEQEISELSSLKSLLVQEPVLAMLPEDVMAEEIIEERPIKAISESTVQESVSHIILEGPKDLIITSGVSSNEEIPSVVDVNSESDKKGMPIEKPDAPWGEEAIKKTDSQKDKALDEKVGTKAGVESRPEEIQLKKQNAKITSALDATQESFVKDLNNLQKQKELFLGVINEISQQHAEDLPVNASNVLKTIGIQEAVLTAQLSVTEALGEDLRYILEMKHHGHTATVNLEDMLLNVLETSEAILINDLQNIKHQKLMIGDQTGEETSELANLKLEECKLVAKLDVIEVNKNHLVAMVAERKKDETGEKPGKWLAEVLEIESTNYNDKLLNLSLLKKNVESELDVSKKDPQLISEDVKELTKLESQIETVLNAKLKQRQNDLNQLNLLSRFITVNENEEIQFDDSTQELNLESEHLVTRLVQSNQECAGEVKTTSLDTFTAKLDVKEKQLLAELEEVTSLTQSIVNVGEEKQKKMLSEIKFLQQPTPMLARLLDDQKLKLQARLLDVHTTMATVEEIRQEAAEAAVLEMTHQQEKELRAEEKNLQCELDENRIKSFLLTEVEKQQNLATLLDDEKMGIVGLIEMKQQTMQAMLNEVASVRVCLQEVQQRTCEDAKKEEGANSRELKARSDDLEIQEEIEPKKSSLNIEECTATLKLIQAQHKTLEEKMEMQMQEEKTNLVSMETAKEKTENIPSEQAITVEIVQTDDVRQDLKEVEQQQGNVAKLTTQPAVESEIEDAKMENQNVESEVKTTHELEEHQKTATKVKGDTINLEKPEDLEQIVASNLEEKTPAGNEETTQLPGEKLQDDESIQKPEISDKNDKTVETLVPKEVEKNVKQKKIIVEQEQRQNVVIENKLDNENELAAELQIEDLEGLKNVAEEAMTRDTMKSVEVAEEKTFICEENKAKILELVTSDKQGIDRTESKNAEQLQAKEKVDQIDQTEKPMDQSQKQEEVCFETKMETENIEQTGKPEAIQEPIAQQERNENERLTLDKKGENEAQDNDHKAEQEKDKIELENKKMKEPVENNLARLELEKQNAVALELKKTEEANEVEINKNTEHTEKETQLDLNKKKTEELEVKKLAAEIEPTDNLETQKQQKEADDLKVKEKVEQDQLEKENIDLEMKKFKEQEENKLPALELEKKNVEKLEEASELGIKIKAEQKENENELVALEKKQVDELEVKKLADEIEQNANLKTQKEKEQADDLKKKQKVEQDQLEKENIELDKKKITELDEKKLADDNEEVEKLKVQNLIDEACEIERKNKDIQEQRVSENLGSKHTKEEEVKTKKLTDENVLADNLKPRQQNEAANDDEKEESAEQKLLEKEQMEEEKLQLEKKNNEEADANRLAEAAEKLGKPAKHKHTEKEVLELEQKKPEEVEAKISFDRNEVADNATAQKQNEELEIEKEKVCDIDETKKTTEGQENSDHIKTQQQQEKNDEFDSKEKADWEQLKKTKLELEAKNIEELNAKKLESENEEAQKLQDKKHKEGTDNLERKQKAEAMQLSTEKLELEKAEELEIQKIIAKKEIATKIDAEKHEVKQKSEQEKEKKEKVELDEKKDEQLEAEKMAVETETKNLEAQKQKEEAEEQKLEAEREQLEKEKLKAEKKKSSDENEKTEEIKAEKQKQNNESLALEKKNEQEEVDEEKLELGKKNADKLQEKELAVENERATKQREADEVEKKQEAEQERFAKEKLELEMKTTEELKLTKINEEKENPQIEALKQKKDTEELVVTQKAEQEQLEKEKLDLDKKIAEQIGAKKLVEQNEEEEKVTAQKQKEEADVLEKKLKAEQEQLEKEKLGAEKEKPEELQAHELAQKQIEKVEEPEKKQKEEQERLAKEKLELETKTDAEFHINKINEEKENSATIEELKQKKDAEEIDLKQNKEQEQLEKEKLEVEKNQAEELQAKKLAEEKLKAEKVEAQKQQKEADELEKKLKSEQEKQEKDKLEAEMKKTAEEKEKAKKKKDAEKLALEKKKEQEQLEKEQLELEKKKAEELKAKELAEKNERIQKEREIEEKEQLELEAKNVEQLNIKKINEEKENGAKIEALQQKTNAEELEVKIKAEQEQLEKEKYEIEKKTAEELQARKLAEEEQEAENTEVQKHKEVADELEKKLKAEQLEKEELGAEKKKVDDEKEKAEKIKNEQKKKDTEKLALKKKREQEQLEKEKTDLENKKSEELQAKELAQKETEEAEELDKKQKAEHERLAKEKLELETKTAEELKLKQISEEKENAAQIEALKQKKDTKELEIKRKAEQEEREKEKLELEKKKAAELQAEELKAQKEKEDADELEKKRKAEQEQLEKKKLEAEKKKAVEEKEKAKKTKAAKQKKEAEKLELEKKKEQELLEKEKMDLEKKKAEELLAVENERAQKQREAEEVEKKQKADQERMEKEKLELEEKAAEEFKLKKINEETENAAQIDALKQKKDAEELEVKQKAEQEQLEKEKLEIEKKQAEELQAKKLHEEKEEAEKVKAQKQKEEADELEKKRKAEQEQLEKEKLEAEKKKAAEEKEKAKKAKAAKQKKEAEKLELEKKKEQEQLEKEKMELEMKKAEELLAVENERAQKQREAEEVEKKQKADQERLEKEKLELEEKAADEVKLKKINEEKENAAQINALKQKKDAEELEVKQKAEQEQLEKEKLEIEKKQAEELQTKKLAEEKEAAEKIKAQKQKEDADELEKKRKAEQEQLEKEKLEAEKKKTAEEKEKVKKAKAAKQKKQAEQLELEKKTEQEQLEKEKMELEKKKAEELLAVENERAQKQREAEEVEKKQKADQERLEKEKLELEEKTAAELKLKKINEKKENAAQIDALKQKKDAEELEEKRKAEQEQLEKEKLEIEKKQADELQAKKLAEEKEAAEKVKAQKQKEEADELEKKRKLESENKKIADEKEKAEKMKLRKQKKDTQKLALEKQKEQEEKLIEENRKSQELEAKKLAADKEHELEKTTLANQEKLELERCAAEELQAKKIAEDENQNIKEIRSDKQEKPDEIKKRNKAEDERKENERLSLEKKKSEVVRTKKIAEEKESQIKRERKQKRQKSVEETMTIADEYDKTYKRQVKRTAPTIDGVTEKLQTDIRADTNLRMKSKSHLEFLSNFDEAVKTLIDTQYKRETEDSIFNAKLNEKLNKEIKSLKNMIELSGNTSSNKQARDPTKQKIPYDPSNYPVTIPSKSIDYKTRIYPVENAESVDEMKLRLRKDRLRQDRIHELIRTTNETTDRLYAMTTHYFIDENTSELRRKGVPWSPNLTLDTDETPTAGSISPCRAKIVRNLSQYSDYFSSYLTHTKLRSSVDRICVYPRRPEITMYFNVLRANQSLCREFEGEHHRYRQLKHLTRFSSSERPLGYNLEPMNVTKGKLVLGQRGYVAAEPVQRTSKYSAIDTHFKGDFERSPLKTSSKLVLVRLKPSSIEHETSKYKKRMIISKDSAVIPSSYRHRPVEFLVRPETLISVTPGQDIILEFEFNGDSNARVTCTKRGLDITTNRRFRSEFYGNTRKYILTNATMDDMGTYCITIENDHSCSRAYVTITVDKKTLFQDTSFYRLLKSENLSMIRSTRSIRSPFRLAELQSQTALGVYRPNRSYNISPPVFYTLPHNTVAECGDAVRFQVSIGGFPSPWVTWYKGGLPLMSGARFSIIEKFSTRILEILHTTSGDAGVYRVVIQNEAGRAEASAKLDLISLKGKPYHLQYRY